MSTNQALIQRQTALSRASTIVSYLTPEEIEHLMRQLTPFSTRLLEGERQRLTVRSNEEAAGVQAPPVSACPYALFAVEQGWDTCWTPFSSCCA